MDRSSKLHLMTRNQECLKMSLVALAVWSCLILQLKVVHSVQPTCSFDDGSTCWSVYGPSQAYRWKVSSNPPTTAPLRDHTNGSGRYLYADAAVPGKAGNTARLGSGSRAPTNGRCLSFWYHMSGANIGTLRILAIKINGQVVELWRKTGDGGSHWLYAAVTVAINIPYELVFEAEKGTAFNGNNIAIDDVVFKEGKCQTSWLLENCGVQMKGLGCFKDAPSDRVLGKLLTSHRQPPLIDWNNFESSIKHLLCECANLAKAKRYKYIGLQFYGECWTASGDVSYERKGKVDRCINGTFQRQHCTGPHDGACVGEALANYIYQLE